MFDPFGVTGKDMGTVSNIVGRLRELIAIPGKPIRSLINKAANLIEQLERPAANRSDE